MNFFKKPKLILSIVVIFVVLIQLSQTNKLPSVFQKIFDFINLFLVGPIFLLLFICLGVYGILIFYKNVLPNPTDAEMRAAVKLMIKLSKSGDDVLDRNSFWMDPNNMWAGNKMKLVSTFTTYMTHLLSLPRKTAMFKDFKPANRRLVVR